MAVILFSWSAATVSANGLCKNDWPACPEFVLQDKLQQIFSLSDCQFISGITCKITYNGKLPLPSEVFFTELDDQGQALGKKTRLIYPHLNPGERGTATFMQRGVTKGWPTKVVLMGKWDGPWKDPY